MQLYAFDLNGMLVAARRALRKTDYRCCECNETVRLRGGPHRQYHFYHVEPTPLCRQHQKGAAHIQLQSYFLQQLPVGDCQLEYSFPSIGRIADVVWHSQKIVFEIQCSTISGEEVLGRNRDYQQMGWEVIWILHDQRYNQIRLSSAEIALQSSPHFFTNMDGTGSGIIYDQFDLCDKNLRIHRLSPLPVKINEKNQLQRSEVLSVPLIKLKHRLQTWKHSFSGDLISSFFSDPDAQYWLKASEMEKSIDQAKDLPQWIHLLYRLWQRVFLNPYQVFFRFVFERMCR